MLEREVKLTFPSAEAARQSVRAAGAQAIRAERLQRDTHFDTADGHLRRSGQVLRLRDDGGTTLLTLKGPVQGEEMKVREERETLVKDASVIAATFDALGLVATFRYEKYREEFSFPGVTVAIDRTPIGVFVELEGEESAIHATAQAMGRTSADFILESYRTIFLARHREHGLNDPDMVFAQS
jgi:adenylate cyclase class 2